MTQYEYTSLLLTGIYDLLTFLLLLFVVYEAIYKSKSPNIAFYFKTLPLDTKRWGWRRQIADFILENRGIELKNVIIKSEPDYIGWNNLGVDAQRDGVVPKKTSEYFIQAIPYLRTNEKLQFFWCDMEANIDVLKKPFKIVVEHDSTLPMFKFFKKRVSKDFFFNFPIFNGVA